jgi:hypothetical protein
VLRSIEEESYHMVAIEVPKVDVRARCT